jgi:hypothetical protein
MRWVWVAAALALCGCTSKSLDVNAAHELIAKAIAAEPATVKVVLHAALPRVTAYELPLKDDANALARIGILTAQPAAGGLAYELSERGRTLDAAGRWAHEGNFVYVPVGGHAVGAIGSLRTDGTNATVDFACELVPNELGRSLLPHKVHAIDPACRDADLAHLRVRGHANLALYDDGWRVTSWAGSR